MLFLVHNQVYKSKKMAQIQKMAQGGVLALSVGSLRGVKLFPYPPKPPQPPAEQLGIPPTPRRSRREAPTWTFLPDIRFVISWKYENQHGGPYLDELPIFPRICPAQKVRMDREMISGFW